MNAKQRIKSAFEHQCPDRVPIGELAIHSPTSSKALGRDAYTGEGGRIKQIQRLMKEEGRIREFLDKFARDTIDVFYALEIDMIPVELNISLDRGAEYRDVTENGWTECDPKRGIWTKYALEPEGDTVYEFESSFSAGGYDAIRDYVEKLENETVSVDESQFYVLEKVLAEAGNEKFILTKVPNLFPVGTSWFTNFMELIYDDIELAKRLLAQYSLRTEAVAERLCQMNGVDALLNGGDWAYNAGPFLSPDFVRELLAPQVKAVAEICHKHGKYLMKHTDGNVMPIADIFFTEMGIDSFQSIEPNAGMSLPVLKKRYGEKITFMGNVDCATVLQNGTEEEIVADTLRAIEEGGKDGGFILSSSNSIHSAIPPENYFTMLKTAKQYGAYRS